MRLLLRVAETLAGAGHSISLGYGLIMVEASSLVCGMHMHLSEKMDKIQMMTATVLAPCGRCRWISSALSDQASRKNLSRIFSMSVDSRLYFNGARWMRRCSWCYRN